MAERRGARRARHRSETWRSKRSSANIATKYQFVIFIPSFQHFCIARVNRAKYRSDKLAVLLKDPIIEREDSAFPRIYSRAQKRALQTAVARTATYSTSCLPAFRGANGSSPSDFREWRYAGTPSWADRRRKQATRSRRRWEVIVIVSKFIQRTRLGRWKRLGALIFSLAGRKVVKKSRTIGWLHIQRPIAFVISTRVYGTQRVHVEWNV